MPTRRQKRPVSVSRVLRRRDYGLISLTNEYAQDIFNVTFSEQRIRDYYESVKKQTITELFEDDLNNRLIAFMQKIHERLFKAFRLGGKKVMDSKGAKLTLKEPSYDNVISQLVQDNLQYVKSIADMQKKIILQEITDGVKSGLTYNQIAKNVIERTKQVTYAQASLIASTEISRASSQAIAMTMQENGIKKYMWVTAGDSRVAPLDQALDRRIFTFGQTGKINVRGTNGKTYTINKSPMPVSDTHPRCRCVLVVAD